MITVWNLWQKSIARWLRAAFHKIMGRSQLDFLMCSCLGRIARRSAAQRYYHCFLVFIEGLVRRAGFRFVKVGISRKRGGLTFTSLLQKSRMTRYGNTPRHIIDISFASIIKVAAVVLALALMYSVKEILALVFLAIIIASTVDRWASFFERYRIPRMGGVALVYVGFVAFLVVVLYFFVPPILEEVKQLIVFLPDYYDVAAKQIFRATRGISPDYARSMQEFVVGLEARITSVTSGALSTAVDVFGGVVAFGVMIVISFYLAMQRRGVENFLRLVTPKAQEEYILAVWRRVEIKLGKWLEGQLLLGCIVGVTVFVGL